MVSIFVNTDWMITACLQLEIRAHLFGLLLQGDVREKGGTNLLGDATSFTLLHISFSNLVQELGLACVNVPGSISQEAAHESMCQTGASDMKLVSATKHPKRHIHTKHYRGKKLRQPVRLGTP